MMLGYVLQRQCQNKMCSFFVLFWLLSSWIDLFSWTPNNNMFYRFAHHHFIHSTLQPFILADIITFHFSPLTGELDSPAATFLVPKEVEPSPSEAWPLKLFDERVWHGAGLYRCRYIGCSLHLYLVREILQGCKKVVSGRVSSNYIIAPNLVPQIWPTWMVNVAGSFCCNDPLHSEMKCFKFDRSLFISL